MIRSDHLIEENLERFSMISQLNVDIQLDLKIYVEKIEIREEKKLPRRRHEER